MQIIGEICKQAEVFSTWPGFMPDRLGTIVHSARMKHELNDSQVPYSKICSSGARADAPNFGLLYHLQCHAIVCHKIRRVCRMMYSCGGVEMPCPPCP